MQVREEAAGPVGRPGRGRSRRGPRTLAAGQQSGNNNVGNKNAELAKLIKTTLMLNDPEIIEHVTAHAPTFKSVCTFLEHDSDPAAGPTTSATFTIAPGSAPSCGWKMRSCRKRPHAVLGELPEGRGAAAGDGLGQPEHAGESESVQDGRHREGGRRAGGKQGGGATW